MTGTTDAIAGLTSCPTCRGLEVMTEPAADMDGAPMGFVVVTCAECGRELGQLPPPAPAAEAEPEPELEATDAALGTEAEEARQEPGAQRHARPE